MQPFYGSAIILSLENLSKVQDKGEFIIRARALSNLAIKEKSVYVVYRLAVLLDERNYSIRKLEGFVCASRNPFFILRFALIVRGANIKRLQSAIVRLGNAVEIANFAAWVKGSDRELLQDIVIKSKNPKAAYTLLRNYREANINRLKNILLASKKPRYVFLLATKLKNKEEIKLIEDIIINGTSNMYVRLFAKYVGGNIKRLEERIIQTQDIWEMKKFAADVPGCERINNLLLLV